MDHIPRMTVKKTRFAPSIILSSGDEANGKLWRPATAAPPSPPPPPPPPPTPPPPFVRLRPFYTCAPRAKHRDNERRHADKTATTTTTGGRSFADSMAIRRDLQVDRCYSSSRGPLALVHLRHGATPPPTCTTTPTTQRERSPTPRVLIK